MMITAITVVLSALLIWTVINLIALPLPSVKETSIEEPFVSILIPVRNEERNIPPLLKSLELLSYDNKEIIVLNDNSTDSTGDLLASASESVQTIAGEKLPDGWVGKVHACHQLGKKASGDYYMFIDADVRLHPNAVETALAAFRKDTGLISGFPKIPLKSLLGHLLVPMQHFLVYVHLPVLLANATAWPPASAAHGAFMMFRADAYEQAGGHAAVRNDIVEDISLMRQVKRSGWQALLINPLRFVTCYMYETNAEVWNGFSKNIYNGIGRKLFAGAGVMLLYSSLFAAPAGIAVYGALTGEWVYLLPLLIGFAIKFLVDSAAGYPRWLFLLMPLSALSFIALLLYAIYRDMTKKGVIWKGRVYE
ncbi:glycosyltransferase [Alkalicoccus luteus]|uniref:glycosyltransferase n=1 Tax=Alkalicoccus luteus TaxID=1237094 RepID=UPI004033C411